MGSFIGVYFSKKENFYCNIAIMEDKSYVANILYSPEYRLLNKTDLTDDYIKCSDNTIHTLYNLDSLEKQFSVFYDSLYFMISSEYASDHNYLFVSKDYTDDVLKLLIYHRIINLYNSLCKTKISKKQISVSIKDIKITKKNTSFIRISVNIDFIVIPHCIANNIYDFCSKQSVLDFIHHEMNIPERNTMGMVISINN